MEKSSPVLGILGVFFLAFGVIGYFLTQPPELKAISPYIIVHGVLGVVTLAIYLVSSWRSFGAFLGQRSTKYGTNAFVYSLAFLAVLVLVNYVASREHYRVDLTENRVYSLAEQSENLVKKLDKDVEILAFLESGHNPKVESLLNSFAYASKRVKVTLIDPDRQPEVAQKHSIQQYNMIRIQYDRDSTTITDISEEAVTNAIIKLSKGKKKTAYFVEGHGEPSIDNREDPLGYGEMKGALENEGYEVKKLLLPSVAKIPDDCSLLILAGPEKSLLDHEIKSLTQYMENGGSLLFMLEPTRSSELKSLLDQWGIEVGDNIVVDQVVRLFTGPTLGVEPIVGDYGVLHPITANFRQKTIFALSRSVAPKDLPPNYVQVTSIAKTSDSSWAETDLNGIFKRGEAKLDEKKDKRGPISIAAAATIDLAKRKEGGKGKAKVVVYGNARFPNNKYIHSLFNKDLLMNTASWLVGAEEMISIRPRTVRASRAQLTSQQGNLLFYFSVLILPEALLIAGLAVWWSRRRR
jgi:ABC-type uncharacterized transport system involved in gliding motility auxiliary subunit